MKKAIAPLVLALALFTFGCAAGTAQQKEPQITGKTKVRCPKCGVEFRVEEGMSMP
ncbi:MAG: hypothetical protein Kow0092_06770 [Deferrisomatales bacterium]